MSDAEMSERKYNFNTVAAVIFIGLGITLFLIIPFHIDEPLIKLKAIGQVDLPAELFPQIIASAFVILGIWYFFKSFAINQVNELRYLNREAITNVTITLILMAIYVPLMVNLGFVVGSAMMIFAMSTYFGNRNFILGAALSVFLPMLIFFIFRRLLLTDLPPFPIDIYPLTHWSLI